MFPYLFNTLKKKIIVIDDDYDIVRLFEIILHDAGYDVMGFTSANELLSNFQTGIYDLLLVDIRMTEMNGFELVEKVRLKDSVIKVCFITSFEAYYNSLIESFPYIDHKCFIHKPIKETELIDKIRGLL